MDQACQSWLAHTTKPEKENPIYVNRAFIWYAQSCKEVSQNPISQAKPKSKYNYKYFISDVSTTIL